MKVVIFSGTTEGRRLSGQLAQRGVAVTVSVATEYGLEEQGSMPGVSVLSGRKNAREMAELLLYADLCVDATHPYATQATATIQTACREEAVPYRRLLRPESVMECDGTILLDSAAQAAAWLSQHAGNVLLTTGAKELRAFSALDPERLFPRVLPLHSSLSACEEAGIPHRNILAMQGPFSVNLNRAMIQQYQIRYLVTKDGGHIGGFSEKAEAARTEGVSLLVLSRPKENGASYETILRECERMISCKSR